MKQTKALGSGAVVILALAAGCASAPPPPPPDELTAARQAYERAASGPAGTYDPAQLRVARETLDRAEASYRRNGKYTRDYAYLAQRDAQIAEARGQAALALRACSTARQAIGVAESQRVEQSEQARASAERQLAQHLAEGPRVIALPGTVLFATGQSELLPGSRSQLDTVAADLKEVGDREIVVLGYTDDVGSPARNVELSRRRAEAVRAYLVSRGLRPDHVRTRGMGESNPIGDNHTREGRAMNRRVEIVVPSATAPGSPTGR